MAPSGAIFNMHIYLKHSIHGAKVAISDLEADYDEQNGWTRYNPTTPSDAEEAAPVNTLGLKRKYTRKANEAEAIIEGV
jgi:hypothetical protein